MNARCTHCDTICDPWALCTCGGVVEFDPPSIRIDALGLRRLIRDRRGSYEPLFSSGVWRYRELLPPIAASAVVSMNEGNVPLYRATDGARYGDVDRLSYLHLGMNPTGSFKDLGMTVAISAAVARGANAVICASTGNTASSMAAYASRAQLRSYAIVPRGRVSNAKLAQMREYGVEVVEVEGAFDDAFAQLSQRSDALVVNSINAYRLEGQKCAAFLLLEARGWTVPDWVLLPGGNLGNVSAIAKGFREAQALGLIDRLPRLGLVRARNGVATTASAIAVAAPKSLVRARRELERFGGVELAVDDDAILAAKSVIGREGIGCEPASAASLAGVRDLRRAGVIGHGEDVVAILTGHLLKDARRVDAVA